MGLSHYVYIGPYLECTPLDSESYQKIRGRDADHLAVIENSDCGPLPGKVLLGSNKRNDWHFCEEARCPDESVRVIPDAVSSAAKAMREWEPDIAAMEPLCSEIRIKFGVIFHSL